MMLVLLSRVPCWELYERLEPYERKLSCTVLRGGAGSNAILLPDLTLFKELGQKQTQQQSRGRKINAMDAYFYQMVERVLREELAVTFGESQQEAGRQLLEVLR